MLNLFQLECSLAAQLQRIFAFTAPYIAEDDLVVTADVDTFVARKDFLKPLDEPDVKVWVFNYHDTIANGFTFNMNFLAMKKSVWREVLGGISNPVELIEHYRFEKL